MNQALKDPDGFSLLEALVALVIVALMATLASAGIGQALKVRERIATMNARLEEENVLRQLLGVALGSARASERETDAPVALLGSHTSLEFVAPLPMSLFRGVLARYKLVWSEAPRGELNLAWAVAAAERAEATRSTLLPGISDFSIAYFGPRTVTESEWSDAWTRRTLPQIVRFQWRSGGGNRELLVRLVTAPIDCAPGARSFPRACFE